MEGDLDTTHAHSNNRSCYSTAQWGDRSHRSVLLQGALRTGEGPAGSKYKAKVSRWKGCNILALLHLSPSSPFCSASNVDAVAPELFYL